MVAAGCNQQTPEANNRVVLYCSVDDVYAKPLIEALEKRTGLDIQPLYDTEATKTAGLTNRIRSERDRPRADVFWSSALLQTLLLGEDDLLEKYVSPAASDVLEQFKSGDGTWTAVGLRGRVVMQRPAVPSKSAENTLILSGDSSMPQAPLPMGISNPQFGTASDWASALAVRHGTDKTLDLFPPLSKGKGARTGRQRGRGPSGCGRNSPQWHNGHG